MSLKDKFIRKDEEFEITEFKTKEEFSKTFEIIRLHGAFLEDEDIFMDNMFYPISNIRTGELAVLTPNKSLKRDLAKLANKSPLKTLRKYAKNNSYIYTMNQLSFYELISHTSVIDKEYTDDEAKDFFQDLLTDASRKGSSDIHISWSAEFIQITYRIDGKMVRQPKKISKELGYALRNIFVNKTGESEYEENEIAGQLTEIIDGQKKEYRLSIGPTIHGYNIVIRLESHIYNDTNLDKWGYSPRAAELIRKLFSAHHGIVLVTGATGSGKSTLLYTCIIEKMNENPIYTPEILTVEDPVEIVIDGINQVQVNTKGNKENWITFSRAIKMFLRQDPDMIIVGEIRDSEVAMQAITAAKTGHLTASTLHTNDIKSTFSRLRELGVENANIEDGVKGVISQRLLNKLCPSCKIKYEKNGSILYKRNKLGCQECISSAYIGCKGRVPVVEIAELNNNPENFLAENFEDYYSIEENIIFLLEEGIIDEEEAQRYTLMDSETDLSKRKEIISIWNKATKGFDKTIFSVYQPIVDDKDYIIGLESFMRMKDSSGNIMLPNLFLALLKKMNMYQKFSMLILDQLIDIGKKFEKKMFWNIDDDNIFDESFRHTLLLKLRKSNMLNKFVIEFEFNEKHIDFIKFCNQNGISIAIDHFRGNMQDIIIIERHKLKIDYIKTNKLFVDGIHKKEGWLTNYLNLLSSTDSEIIINFIETDAMFKEIVASYKDKIYGFQGWGIRRPDFIENYLLN